ncbi:MAG: 2-C-methyl-D-erythritol 2,4-cyclodiphosphate synthase [Deltaproteobacteria bacterium]|nr:2-C-methyl-D-erythritol 2,4-cyclodiphosphate synthase [Deltaproteobacteria bacterium]
MRIGYGYDVHRLVQGRPLILGGVVVPYTKGLDGHSDADVLLHAVIDALLGATALGDIGTHFPPSDAAYKNISSMKLLDLTMRLVKDKGYTVSNIDSTIVCQSPRLLEHIPAMVTSIAVALGCPVDCVSVKAKTEEGLGFTGSGQGISAHAVALVRRSTDDR